MIKVTKKYLQKWIEDQLSSFKMELKVKSITPVQMGKRARMNFTIKTRIVLTHTHKEMISFIIPCYYTLGEIQYHLNNGYDLYWNWKGSKWIMSSEIDLRKKDNG